MDKLLTECCYAGQPRTVAARVTAQTPIRLLGPADDSDNSAVATGDSDGIADPVSRSLASAEHEAAIEKANAAAAAAVEAASEAVGGELQGPTTSVA